MCPPSCDSGRQEEEYPRTNRRNLMILGFLASSSVAHDPQGLVTLEEKKGFAAIPACETAHF